ncbi:MAG: hypothetical protein CMJ87_12795 [Planctomycetes bacterium]|nr:hypothetical protein [Planctomycetota bacterium]
MNKTSTWPLLVVAAALLAALVAVVAQPKRSADQILEDVREQRTSGQFDDHLVHLDLNHALLLAQETGDNDLAARILLERADLLTGLGSHGLARDDLVLVLREGGLADNSAEGSLLIEERIIELDIAEGRYGVGLRNVEALLERQVERHSAWLLAGRLQAAIGAEREAECAALCARSLARMTQDEARSLVEDVCARDQRDPLRAQSLRKLQGLFPPGDEATQQELLDITARASDRYAAARSAWAASLAAAPSPTAKNGLGTSAGTPGGEAINGLLDLLLRAGQSGAALDLGLVCLEQTDIASDEAFLRRLLQVMVAEGQLDQAREVAQDWMNLELPGSPETFETICLALYRAEAWGPMHQAQDLLRRTGSSGARSMANFYLGLSKLARKRPAEAQFWLDRYLKNNPVEPFPGAAAAGYRLISTAHRSLGSGRETASLLGAVDLEPAGDGEDWLRLAEIQTTGTSPNFRLATQRQLQAMVLLPRRWEELMPTWRAYGEESLIGDALDTKGLQQELVSQDRFLPTLTVGPYGLFRVAEHHREDSRPRGVIAVLNELLRQYPGFIPALDLIVEAHLDLNQQSLAAQRLTERLELAGRDGASALHFERLDTAAFPAHLRRRLVEGDPARSGRVVMARELLNSGAAAAARLALGRTPAKQMDREERLLLARISLEMEQPRRAVQILSMESNANTVSAPGSGEEAAGDSTAAASDGQLATQLDTSPSHTDMVSFRLELAALLMEGNGDEVETRLQAWLEDAVLERDAALPLVDEFLERGATLPALNLLQALDAAPETRGGEVLIRLAITQSLLGQVQQARESVARAEAFLTDGRPELMRVLEMVEHHDWRNLPAMALEVRSSEFQPNEVQDLALLLCEERFVEAGDRLQALSAAGVPDNAGDRVFLAAALAAMTAGEVTVPNGWGAASLSETSQAVGESGNRNITGRDPRELLALRLALDVPGFEPWIIKRLFDLPADQVGALWPTWFGLRALAALGRDETVDQSLHLLQRPRYAFPPAWDLSERRLLARTGSRDHPDMVELRRKRWSILGRSDADRTQATLDRVALFRSSGKLPGALQLLEGVVEIADPLLALPLLARLRGETNDVVGAIEAWRRLLPLLTPPDGTPSSNEAAVAEFVRFMENVHERMPGQLNREALNRELQDLARAFPRDPLPVIALARIDLGLGLADATRTSVARSLQRLEVFRRATGHTPLEHLRPGVTERWVRHLAELDMERALTALDDELDRQPGSITLWRLFGDLQRKSGDRNGAQETYYRLLTMSGDSSSAEALALLAAEAGDSARRVAQYLNAATTPIPGAPAGETQTTPKVRRDFIRALAETNGLRPEWRAPLATLRALTTGTYTARDLGREEVALELALAHLRRGEPRDGAAALELLKPLATLAKTPYRADLLRALISLASRSPLQAG